MRIKILALAIFIALGLGIDQFVLTDLFAAIWENEATRFTLCEKKSNEKYAKESSNISEDQNAMGKRFKLSENHYYEIVKCQSDLVSPHYCRGNKNYLGCYAYMSDTTMPSETFFGYHRKTILGLGQVHIYRFIIKTGRRM